VTTGTPPLGSFGGGPFDTVNLGNLNVHFSIPIVSKAGRGMPFTYLLSYDSSIWTQVTNNGVTSWFPTANWGWRGDTEIATGYVSYDTSETTCQRIPPKGIFRWFNFVYHDPFGTSHAVSGSAEIDQCQNTKYNLASTARDGSDYAIYYYVDGSGTDRVTSRSGSVINPPFGAPTGSGTATDANGNQITTDGSGKFYDTLSGTTPVLTVAGTSPHTFTYTSPSGNKAYSLNYSPQNVWTSFGCGIGEYQMTNVSMVSNISLPDGTQYTLTYEQNTSHSGYITGRLASVKLPTGGTISYTYTGANGGIVCADGSTLGLTRSTPDSSTPWTYVRSGSDPTWTTTVTDPLTNETIVNFEKDSSTTNSTNNFYETQRVVKDGSNTLSTTITCYNGNGVSNPSTCNNTAVNSPISGMSLWGEVSDANFAIPKPGHFLAVDNMEADKYQPIQDGLLLLRTAMFAEGIGDAAASAKWATRAFTEAHRQSGTGLLDAFGWLPIPHFVETGAYDKAIQSAYAFSKRKRPDEASIKTFELNEQDRKRVEEIYTEPRILDRALLFCLVPIALRLATLRFDQDIASELAAVTSVLDQVSSEPNNPWKEAAQFLRNMFSGAKTKTWRQWHDEIAPLYASNRVALGILASLASILDASLAQSLVSQIGLARNLEQVFKISPSIRTKFVAPFFTRYWQEATSTESVRFRTSATYTQKAFSEEASHPPLVRVKKLLARMVFCIGLTLSEDLRAWLEEHS
jgi:hypothetical protein